MTPQRFDHLLSFVKADLSPRPNSFRQGLSAEEKLLVTLRYLATGNSQQSNSFNFQLGRSTVSQVIKQTCDAIWNRLAETYMKFPSTLKEWQQISDGFEQKCNFPHVIGALGGE